MHTVSWYSRFAKASAHFCGRPFVFALAVVVILIWIVTGPLFDFSDTWQLVINTATTIITFLMVFVIQHAQNKDMRAVQLKLNELIAAVEGASNRLIDVEDLSDREVEHLYSRFQTLAKTAQKVSHGAKLTIDSSDDEDQTDERDSQAPPAHAHSEADKKPVAVKREAKQHSPKKRP